ncbi:MAG: AAA family ATPase [Planctomycetaceae bacterium]
MYTWFYGFSEEPFNVNPDPRFLYLTETHQQALDSMNRGILDRGRFILILGELGSGKTTLIQHLLETIDRTVKAVAVFRPPPTFEELLGGVLQELGVPSAPQNKVSLVRQLNDYLHSLTPDQTLAILIDDAQELSPEIMEELFLLPTPETLSARKLQIVLAGQPELKARLDSPNLREVKQRVEIMGDIQPMSEQECRQYIAHRLEKVDSETNRVFTPEAVDLICQHAQGNPRTVNILCDNAFLVGYGLSKKKIDSAVVTEVLEDLDFVDPEEWEARRPEEGRRARREAARGRSALLQKIGYSALALVGVGAIILLGRIFLKETAEPPTAKFAIEPPALRRKAPPVPSEEKPERIAQTVSRPEAAKASGIQETPPRPAGRPPAQEAQPSSPPPGGEKRPSVPAVSAEKKISPPVHSPKVKPGPPTPGKTETAAARAEGKPSSPDTRSMVASKPEPGPAASPPASHRSKAEARIKKTVTVKPGENIYSIAAHNYHVANTSVVDQILEVNPQIVNSRKLFANQQLSLPDITEESLLIAIGDGAFQVRLGAFLKPQYANFLKEEPVLRGKGVQIIPRKLPGGETWYRAVAGKFSTREEGLKVIRELKAKGLSPYFPGFRIK